MVRFGMRYTRPSYIWMCIHATLCLYIDVYLCVAASIYRSVFMQHCSYVTDLCDEFLTL